jgi:hypothetical protein
VRRNLLALLVVLLACGTALAVTTYNDIAPGTPPAGGGNEPFDPPVPNVVTFYNNEADFLAAAGSVVNESFGNTSAEPGGVCSGDGNVLNSSTNDSCYQPGDVLDGFTLEATVDSTGYVVLGSGFLGNPIPVVGPNTFTASMDLTFDPASAAAGFQVFGDLVGPVVVDLMIYDDGGTLLDMATVVGTVNGTFIGMTSDDPIALIEFRAPDADGELIGNLYFGGGDGGDGGGDGGAVPATSTWGVILLIALFMGISLFYLRRRAKA